MNFKIFKTLISYLLEKMISTCSVLIGRNESLFTDSKFRFSLPSIIYFVKWLRILKCEKRGRSSRIDFNSTFFLSLNCKNIQFNSWTFLWIREMHKYWDKMSSIYFLSGTEKKYASIFLRKCRYLYANGKLYITNAMNIFIKLLHIYYY